MRRIYALVRDSSGIRVFRSLARTLLVVPLLHSTFLSGAAGTWIPEAHALLRGARAFHGQNRIRAVRLGVFAPHSAVDAPHHDGYALAEADLKQRGPGEVCGVRQHGVTDFHVADLIRDRKILDLARAEARSLLEEDPELKTEPRLRIELMRTLGHTLHLAGTA